ncbi:anti-sigma factor domain-containing protein [Phosphitispora sp. TUW77]|uniref:anti-sigma factor domain-containing protein n=1 Tax=Phosphitispora sp. TUW77 TaxID=3152361 RepID=UPI003AB479FC
MERITGVVMDIQGNHVIMITPKGEFKRVLITGRIPGIGEEINIPVARKRFFNLPRASWAAVAAAVILLLAAGPLLTMMNQPAEFATAYVSIDVGPSIELTRSNLENVLEAQAYNHEGEEVLKNLNLEGMKINEAVTSITKEAVELGYIRNSDGNSILISVVPLLDSGVEKNEIEKLVLASANDVLSDSKINNEITTISVPSDIRENARSRGMSTGKYALLIEAVNEGLIVTEEEMKEKSIDDVISQAGGQAEVIIGMARAEEQFEIKEQKFLALTSIWEENEDTGPVNGDMNTSAGNTGTQPDKESTDDKIRYIEPIRRNTITTAPISQGPDTQLPETSQNGPGSNPAAGSIEEPTDVNNNVYENTMNNYMGPELPGDTIDTGEPMYILRPKF